MLSRATTFDNLTIRAPTPVFLTLGPPADMAARLGTFSAHAENCKKPSAKLVRDLGLSGFLHG
eukprot:5037081-Pyramimonas_sp.AAC.1